MRNPAAWFALSFALPAFAWNSTGHRVCAAITYDHLTPQARARVDELIRHHPDYATILTRDSPPDPAARARAAFIAASTWPDLIRSDKRFFDDSKPDATPTPQLDGFPDMKRHTHWHYIDVPYSPEGVWAEVPPPPTALSEITRLLTEIAKPIEDPVNPAPVNRAYDLPWLLHIEEDLHQPLHTVSRFLKSQPMGDEGGNNVFLIPSGATGGRLYQALHSVWDGAIGQDSSDANVTMLAKQLVASYVPEAPEIMDPAKWLDEGFVLSVKSVYTFGLATGTKEMPLEMPEKYEANARSVASVQIAKAGLRMAAILNSLFN
jgi:hypothetical protein